MATWRKLITPFDIALGLVILVAGVLSLQAVAAGSAVGAGTLRIEIDGRLVREITFAATDPQRLITVQAPRGEVTIELTAGKARVLPLPVTTCPEGICWNAGWTDHPAKPIVCLPNRLVVRLVGAADGIDGITR